MLLGVDVGGTFTDAVLAFDGGVVTAKSPTTPDDQSEGVIAAVARCSRRPGAIAADVAEFSHGMTVATNALLEGRGARTALIATEGFTDLIALGRQTRAELYRLCAAHPAPLVPRRAAVRRARADGPGRPAARARASKTPPSSPSASPTPSPRRSRSCCCTPTATPSTNACSARRSAKRCPTPTCRCRTRWSAPSASTSAPPRPRSTLRSRRCSPATCAASSTAPARRSFPSRRSCSQTAA